jgi:hypothetical protein
MFRGTFVSAFSIRVPIMVFLLALVPPNNP